MKTSVLLLGLVAAFWAAGSALADMQYYLVSGYTSNNIVRYDAATGAVIDQFVPSGSGGLSRPEGLAIGPDGNLYVSSSNTHRIKRYDGLTGAYLGNFATDNGLEYPRGITFGPDGNLYVASSNDMVLRFNGTTGAFIDEFVKSGTPGLIDPQDLVFRGDGKLYVSNGWTHTVIRCNAQTGEYIDTFVGSPELDVPQGMAFGADAHLYVADSDTNCVFRYDGQTGALIDAFVPPGYGGLNHAEDVLFGPDGSLFVTSHYSDNVLRYNGGTGEFLGVFASGGGLDAPTYILYVPEPGALVLLVITGLVAARRR